jgi:hypothetical protein
VKLKCSYWRCDWIGTEADVLTAPDPFNEGNTLYACPQCRDQTVIDCCDEPGCTEAASCGWPVENGPYRHTCLDHSCFKRQPPDRGNALLKP